MKRFVCDECNKEKTIKECHKIPLNNNLIALLCNSCNRDYKWLKENVILDSEV
jgi:transcription elongation factor Elf1